MPGDKSYERFEVFKRSFELSLKVHHFSLSLPRFEQSDLGNQLRRSSKSICSNFAEGFAKQSFSIREFRKYLIIAIGSSNESIVWLKYCKEFGYLSETEFAEWSDEYEQIARMLSKLAQNQQ
ncbi:four helix bundle protein [Leptospira weilii str. UI 13098]|uniref:Four helix bundle protein n=1 Tax=Leptospira weilii str. UI 13098 TaxID=1088542 RepID=M6Q0R3_9LEPT|nr:four helix bundle protein [Leptospira weilii str. UI 13098]